MEQHSILIYIHHQPDPRDTNGTDQRGVTQPLCAQLPVLCALRHVGRDDLPRYDSGYADSIARNNCAVGRHRCSMVPLGTIPCRCHLLRHRLFVDIKEDFLKSLFYISSSFT